LRYALERYGLAPEKEVTILQAGNMPAILASLETGKIQGAMLSAPFTLRAKNMGLPLMADLQMLGLEYQHTGLATTQAFIKARPELVRSVMKAYVEGIHYYKTHRAESLAILAKYLRTSDTDVLTEVYEDVGLRLTAEKPYPTLR
jgi:NitT/TauT family transport system substrate-binding protein